MGPGFGASAPPGFCWEGCDCMDDQRGQQAWEIRKDWIDKARGVQAQAALDNFSNEQSFVRARGQVSKMFYFECLQDTISPSPQIQAAIDLAVVFQVVLRQACLVIPKAALTVESEPLFLPSRAILSNRENMDYLPIRIDGELETGAPLPPWLKVNPVSGQLSIDRNNNMSSDLKILLKFNMFEGTVKTHNCTIALSESMPVMSQLNTLFSQWTEPSQALEPGVRALIQDQLAQLSVGEQCSLGRFIETLSLCQSMLRAASVSNLLPVARWAPAGRYNGAAHT